MKGFYITSFFFGVLTDLLNYLLSINLKALKNFTSANLIAGDSIPTIVIAHAEGKTSGLIVRYFDINITRPQVRHFLPPDRLCVLRGDLGIFPLPLLFVFIAEVFTVDRHQMVSETETVIFDECAVR